MVPARVVCYRLWEALGEDMQAGVDFVVLPNPQDGEFEAMVVELLSASSSATTDIAQELSGMSNDQVRLRYVKKSMLRAATEAIEAAYEGGALPEHQRVKDDILSRLQDPLSQQGRSQQHFF